MFGDFRNCFSFVCMWACSLLEIQEGHQPHKLFILPTLQLWLRPSSFYPQDCSWYMHSLSLCKHYHLMTYWFWAPFPFFLWYLTYIYIYMFIYIRLLEFWSAMWHLSWLFWTYFYGFNSLSISKYKWIKIVFTRPTLFLLLVGFSYQG